MRSEFETSEARAGGLLCCDGSLLACDGSVSAEDLLAGGESIVNSVFSIETPSCVGCT